MEACTHRKVATTLVVGQPRMKLVLGDLVISATSSSGPGLSHISDTRTLSFSLKLPPARDLATSSKSLNRNRCLSWFCTPCNRQQCISTQVLLPQDWLNKAQQSLILNEIDNLSSSFDKNSKPLKCKSPEELVCQPPSKLGKCSNWKFSHIETGWENTVFDLAVWFSCFWFHLNIQVPEFHSKNGL